MFSIKHNECVGFESRWKVKKVSCVSSTQTTGSETKEQGTGPSRKVNAEIQTESKESNDVQDVNDQKLARWLRAIYPKVKKELDDASNSKAFKGYQLRYDVSDACLKLLQSLNSNANRQSKEVRISTLSWNSSGAVLAVTNKRSHHAWCDHEGSIAFYNLTKDDRLGEVPKLKISTESCVVDVKFHPVSSTLVAVGLYTGIIVVWNIHHDEEEIVAKVNAHTNGVAQLEWINDINVPKAFLLVSSGSDGLLKLWTINSASCSLDIKEIYKIKPPILAVVPSAAGEAVEETDRYMTIGTLSFGFSKHVPDMFAVGTEAGLIVQCSMLGATKLRGNRSDEPLYDPTIKHYVPHKGKVFSLQFSPNRKEMFLTHGSDGEIRVYIIDQEEPAQIIFVKDAFNCIKWVPYEERVITGCGSSGVIEFFHLTSGELLGNVVRDKVHFASLNCMEINRARTNIAAVGDDKGNVQLWKIPWALFTRLK